MPRSTSPLRYPGGKSSLLALASTILQLNDLDRGHYAEPFAGGAGLALGLLYDGHVGEIHINDLDHAIWSFWHCVLNHTDAFIDKVLKTPVTVSQWRKQREIYFSKSPRLIDIGFAAFFLNRTNRSGVIKMGGVIGGLDQTGEYKIDCRFNRDELAKRIQRIGRYRDRIHLTGLDAIEFVRGANKSLPKRSLLFIDPPYFNKGAKLYANYYRQGDHAALASTVLKCKKPWVVTYDEAPEIRELYRDRRQFAFGINYSLQEKRIGTEVLIASKGLWLPSEARDRQTNRPQYRAAT